MKRLDALIAFQRRVSLSKELNHSIMLEVLELCAEAELENISEKYVLMQLCEYGFWEQAVFWLIPWTVPHWTVRMEREADKKGWTVRLVTPLFMVTRSNLSCARALLDALIEATTVDERVRVSKRAAS